MSNKLHNVISESDWKTNRETARNLQKWLATLKTYKPDQNALRETRIGVAVSKLRKHDDNCVSAYASMLTGKWKSALDIKTAGSTSRGPENDRTMNIEAERKNEAARQRLQQSYANEKAKREARTSVFLDNPVAKRGKGRKSVSTTTITRYVNPPRPGVERKIPRAIAPPSTSKTISQVRPSSNINRSSSEHTKSYSSTSQPIKKMTPEEERHHRRQMQYRMLAEKKARETGKTVPASISKAVPAAKSTPAPASHSKPRSSSDKSERRPVKAAPTMNPKDKVDKEFLDKMYPRVAGRPPVETNTKQKRDEGSKAPAPLKEGEREVMHWLKGLTEDMSQYAQTFFDNGFDSMKLVSTINDKDIAAMIPKRGHCRVVEMAVQSLKQSRKSKPPPVAKRKRPSYDDDEYDSDDGFVVNDEEDHFVPGAITSMFRKGRGRRPAYYDDDGDSSDMEASFEEIQREEYRSARYGDYEDEVEDLRNRKHKEKKLKRKQKD
ncbi:hypothetical protein Ae201684P_021808 [Aphanomyces euteiches]|uniref:SAM domain-containing protein n=1 Tax=Aphanomyces euteiches TaxID=100861 RepID=A0A6G0WSJ9_9STRA|nr:hypothetical protein Ae201684_012162 [Aphanomyces euteiches]KAH9056069.1 hypothetical protein Ae201684P_021808 [Aphanomyces euteiches]